MDEEVCNRVSHAVNGARFEEAVSALISTLMMVIVGMQNDAETQNKMLESIVNLMRNQLQTARIVNETGSLPH